MSSGTPASGPRHPGSSGGICWNAGPGDERFASAHIAPVIRQGGSNPIVRRLPVFPTGRPWLFCHHAFALFPQSLGFSFGETANPDRDRELIFVENAVLGRDRSFAKDVRSF